jgi:histone deacetylase complex regulatory component SIN3
MILEIIIFNNKEYKKWLRVATVELNGYFKVSDFHSVLQTFFPTTSHILYFISCLRLLQNIQSWIFGLQ